MSILATLLTLVALRTCTAETCPDGYKCQWQNGWFVLHCKPRFAGFHFQTLSGIITDLPTNAARLKISCFNLHVPVQLNFANLSHTRELTLDRISAGTRKRLFHGVTNITHLVLRNLSWKRIEKDTFSGLSSLLSLSIERLNELESMDQDILKPLLSLQSLKFRYVGSTRDALNYTDYARVLGGITSSNVHTLILYAIHSAFHTETEINIDHLFMYGAVNKTLKSLDLGRNFISIFSGSPRRTLPVVEYVSLAKNAIIGKYHGQPFFYYFPSSFWIELVALSRLENLDLSGMNTMFSPISNDELFSLVVSNGNTFMPIKLGQRLESLSIANTIFLVNVYAFSNRISFFDKYDVLKSLDISNARSTGRTTYNVDNLHALEYFNLQNVQVDGIDAELFNKMPNLKMLLLGENDIGSAVANDTESRIFRNIDKLAVLDLERCNLTEIPPNVFSSLQSLQNLNLSRNSLHEFHVELQRLGALQILNLSHNKLTTLSIATRTELNNLAVHVDLSGNPLDCSCNNTDFVSWTLTSPVNFLNKDETFCADENNTWNLFSSVDMVVLVYICHGNVSWNNSGDVILKSNVTLTLNVTSKPNFTSKPSDQLTIKYEVGTNIAWKYVVIISVSVILVVFAVILPLVMYVLRHYRWKFALCLQRFREETSSSGVEDEHVYERDAFICFNSNDRAWVCNDLLQHMEEHEISTVIHHRDFLPGSILEESIRESIDKCRFTVLVLSPDFLSSNWCLLEMYIARSRIISQGRDVIVPIILREFPTSQLTRTLEGILSRSYLEWTDDLEDQTLFWNKLVTKLKHGGNIRPLNM
ncbi:hypothetical protein LSAT2_005540 [Lamellibrachia satsuma]|nr:hypothetical protein LSAT2_005540 [Lamellibrachia satsuma]